MGKRRNGGDPESIDGEKVEKLEGDRDPIAVLASLKERVSRWQHFTNHDAIEAVKELDFLESQFE